jgi:hypothetical protein
LKEFFNEGAGKKWRVFDTVARPNRMLAGERRGEL